MRRSAGPRPRRHYAGHELKGRVPEGHIGWRGSDYSQDQQKGPITRAEFLASALKAANDKAHELGWIV